MEKKGTVEFVEVPSAGLLLARLFTENRTRKSVVSRMLGVRLQTVLEYQKKTSIQTGTLWKLSMLLKHNFFKDLADQIPKEFSTFSPPDTTLQDRIAVLERENLLLNAQIDILKEVMKK